MRVIEANTIEYDDPHWEQDPNDSWDRPDTYCEYVGLLVKDQGFAGWREVAADWDGPAYVVVVKYTSGDTFGTDYGRVNVLAAFPDEETADEFVRVARGETDEGKVIRTDYSFEFQGESYYRDWVGYFESLEDIFVERVE